MVSGVTPMPYKDQNSKAARESNRRKQKKYRQLHPEKVKEWNSRQPRNRWYKHQYGTSEAEFEAQITAQHNLCPIGNHPFGDRGKGKISPCQDHDHETGANRLILCREHNVALGMFHDSIFELESAISYLKGYPKV